MTPTVCRRVCLLYMIEPFVEESKLLFFFPRLKQLQIAAKLFSPGNTESSTAQEGERLSRSNENPR